MKLLALWALVGGLFAPCKRIQVLPEGTLAPCSGLLWSREQSKAALQLREVELPRLQVELDRIKGVLTVQLEGCQASLGATLGAFDTCTTALQEATPASWTSPLLWGGVGVAIGVVAGVLVVVALE